MAVEIANLALMGVGAVITIMLIGAAGNFGLQYLAQQSLNNQLSLGVQGVVGVNNLNTIDHSMERRDRVSQGGDVAEQKQ